MYVLANRPKETQFSAHKKWQQNHQHLRVYKSFSFTFLFSHLFITYQEKEGKKKSRNSWDDLEIRGPEINMISGHSNVEEMASVDRNY